MDLYTQTDLACESVTQKDVQKDGGDIHREQVGKFFLSELRIQDQESEQRIGKPQGTYITVECGRISCLDDESSALLEKLLAGKLTEMAERLTGKKVDSDFGVFVAGLGNAEMTADAIGPKTVGYLTATRHLREHEQALYQAIGCSALSALAPGVLGQTGIETLELLRGVVSYVKPHLVLVVDALAARSCKRLAATLQLSDAGICPGSGVGNHRAAITRETLGVPVIALGVPTVVNSATLVYDALQEAGIQEIGESLQQVLDNGKSFFVSPKDSDVIAESVSRLLAGAIGSAFVRI